VFDSDARFSKTHAWPEKCEDHMKSASEHISLRKILSIEFKT